MEANQILKSDILDIIFEGKNKEYGAYDLRKTYNKRITIAMIATILAVIFFLVASAVANKFKPKDNAIEIQTKDLALQQIQAEEPPPPPPPPVAVTPDSNLSQGVTDATKDFPTVKASVNNGEITLTGSIKRADLQKLMQTLNTLNPSKINNQLTIK